MRCLSINDLYRIIRTEEDAMKSDEINDVELNDIALVRVLNTELLDLFDVFCQNRCSKKIECVYEAYILLADRLDDIYRKNKELLYEIKPKALFQVYPDLFGYEEEVRRKQKRLRLYHKQHVDVIDSLWSFYKKPIPKYDNEIIKIIETAGKARASLVIGNRAIMKDDTPVYRLSYNDIRCKIVLDGIFEVTTLQYDSGVERTIRKAFDKPNKSVKSVANMVQFRSRVNLPDELRDLFFQASSGNGGRFTVNKNITIKMLRDNRLDPKKIDKQILRMYGITTDR